MPANRLFKNRLRGYKAQQKQQKTQPIPPGFTVCPVQIGANQVADIRQLYAHAYAAARRNVIPFYLRPVLGTGN